MSSNCRYTYQAYGLIITSEIELPELTPAKGCPDVIVSEGVVERVSDEVEWELGYSHASPGRYYMVHRILGKVEVRNSSHITLDLLDDAPPGVVRTVIANLALGVVLHQREVLTLHASAVSIGGQAVAFIGDKGWGKSTTASALYRRGHTVITDDVLAVDITDTELPSVRPAFAQLKLWPDAIDGSLGEDPNTLERIYGSTEKRVRQLEAVDSFKVIPLAGVYVLGRGSMVEVERLSLQSAFFHLMEHSYTSQIIERTSASKWHLMQTSQLAGQVPTYALRRPSDLSLLSEIARRIENQIICSRT